MSAWAAPALNHPNICTIHDIDECEDFGLAKLLSEKQGRPREAGPADLSTFDKILNRNPVPLGQLNPQLPPKPEEIVSRLLDKDRESRYQSAALLEEDPRQLQRDSDSRRLAAAALPAEPPSKRRRLSYVIPIFAIAAVASVAGVEASTRAGHGDRALRVLEPAMRYEPGAVTLTAIYTRGLAYLQTRSGREAAEFQKILDHRGVAGLSVLYPSEK
ncbi:MAG: hypothetical protein HYU27_04465 [Acidobacteria bacterium]|nr:hypothetical protein [Acidobacteriota bacterium]